MKPLINNHPYAVQRSIAVRDYGQHQRTITKHPLPIFPSTILLTANPKIRVPCRMLVDTGTDVTLMCLRKLNEIEQKVGRKLPIEREIYFHGKFVPAFDLAVVFPGGMQFSSKFGFVLSKQMNHDVADIWLGQDILSQLNSMFYGVDSLFTLIDPSSSSGGNT